MSQLHAGRRIRSLIVRVATKPVRIWAPEREVTYQNGAPAPSIGVPTPRVIVESVDVVPTPRVIVESVDVVPTPWCNDSCRNSMRGAGQYALFLRS